VISDLPSQRADARITSTTWMPDASSTIIGLVAVEPYHCIEALRDQRALQEVDGITCSNSLLASDQNSGPYYLNDLKAGIGALSPPMAQELCGSDRGA